MKRTHVAALSLLAALLVAGGAFHAGRTLGHASGEHAAHAPAIAADATGNATGSAAGDTGANTAAQTAGSTPERKILYWHDPMVPGTRFDKPGKSPFMDMQLVPVYADADSTSGTKIDPAVQQNLGIRHATVRRIESSTSIDAIGSVQFDERLGVAVQTRVAGYVEHLAVRAPMEQVRKGQPLATVFAPEWLAPQNEWLALQRSGVSQDFIAAARERMRAMSIPADLIRQSEKLGTAQARFTLTAPSSGVVTELGVREGVAVTPGMTLFRIGGLDKVWAVAEIPEAQAMRIRVGQKARAILQSDATQSFDGELTEILPQIDAATRTLKARFTVDNAQRRLVPGMLLRLQVAGPTTTRLVVSSEAVIRTGRRAVVIVRKDTGAFEPRDVTLGADLGDDIEIVQGLAEGEQVVASGQFLIDSEARLRTVFGNMAPQKP
ncbi:efflux RND transporter periplasmic adaptor subunit [Variovorax sp. dw_954]|uniref:efflux RND transporter periplasmic adaptor subunit n=1 Tax=Variovorax sp. dw_954 TaxID=2720078 RepID=UPI001BD54C5C|nr:efflux RND transporter periplasmic adaptor subunit [Variovorax sp. dw_954]